MGLQAVIAQAANFSHQAVAVRDENPTASRELWRQAHESSKRCRVLFDELFRREPPQ
ncbi:hypothetical protein LC593_35885 [Nostoc sp. CHAB 5844]|nr:hypothetical protein [Nostoc sp. CHAB 5844]